MSNILWSQTYNITNGSFTTCSGTFYDSGGTGNYTNNETYTTTFFPSTPGAFVVLTFTSFSTELNWDGMMIYNGNSTSAPLISSGLAAGFVASAPAGSWRGTGSPGTITSTAVDGSLTIVFTSDASVVFSGWEATISCFNPTPCSGTPNPGVAAISLASGCTGQNFTLSATSLSGGSGLTFQWQSAPTSSGAWTNITGGTTANFATSTSTVGQTFYRLVSTCAGVNSTSNVVSYTASGCGIVPTTGVSYLTSCNTTIYDSGGATGSYSDNENGTLIIRPSSMWDIITVSGTCDLRNSNDFLSIDEGEDSNTGSYYSQFVSDQTINYTAQGPGIPLSIHFVSNASNVDPGFQLTVSCICAKPTAITLSTVDAPCGGTGSVTVTSATPTILQPWVLTTNENNTLPALSWLPTAPATNAWISGNANMQAANNNQVEITAASTSQNGTLVYESFGQNRGSVDFWFDLYAGSGTSADGLALSYGPGIATSPVSTTFEVGVGTGLTLSFDSYPNSTDPGYPNCNGTNYRNIYLSYNSVTIACYTTTDYTAWRNAQCPVNLFITETGLAYVYLYLGVTPTTIFNGVQLPAGYVSANKSSWRAAFTARTGGETDQHRIDNVNIYHPTEFEYSINGTTWQASTTFSGLTSGSYTMYVRYKGNTSCSFTQAFTISAPIASTAPTSITGTNTICTGSSTTLTSIGGTLGTEAEDVWYEGVCPTECFTQEWITQPYASLLNTTVNSITNGVLNVTSTSGDPMINMTGLGSFNPSSCRYINIRYRVTVGVAGNVEIFFFNTANPTATAGQTGFGTLISDNTWRTVSVDMWTDPDYLTGGNITGWRFDWTTATGVTMDIDFITLSDTPIFSTGSSITVTPTVNTTYFTNKKGPCNTTTCVSQLVTIVQPPTTATVGTAQTICGLTSSALGGNTPTVGTGSWSIVSGGTGTFSDASSPSSTFTATASGVYVLRWTITNAPCTPSTAEVTVTFFQNPTTATVGANQTICSSLTSTVLGGNTPTVGTGAWSIVSGGTGTFNSSATTPGATFTANSTGSYVLRWTITNGTCTPSTADITVVFGVTPSAGITGTTTFCSGSNTTLTASGGGTYAWSDGLGSSATTSSITLANTYTVTVTSAEGCTTTASQAVTVTTNVTPTFTQIQPICQNSSSPTLPLSSTNSPAITGTWSPSTITTSTIQSATYTFTPTTGICATTATMSISIVSCAQIDPCSILVYQIGNNATATSSAPVSILEFQPNFTNTSMPAVYTGPTSGSNNLTNISGAAPGDANSILTGYMNTHNGFTAIPGYSDPDNTTNIASSSDNERVNLINAAQSTIVTNAINLFFGSSSIIRGAVPIDASRFYCFGAGPTQATSGIFYFDGAVFTQIYTDANCLFSNTTNNIRNIDIFNGQLYMLRRPATGALGFLFAVGNGLPSATATLTTVASGASTNNFSSFSISPDGSTMYTADNSSISQGLYKWRKVTNGSTFTQVTTSARFNVGNSIAAATRYIGLAVDWNVSPVKIYASSSTSASNGALYLVSLTESAGIGANSATWPTAATITQVYTATNNSCTGCKYTGVDFAPTITTSLSASTSCVGTPITATASAIQAAVSPLTYQWFKIPTLNTNYIDYYGATTVQVTDGTGGSTATFTPSIAGTYFCEVSGATCAKFRTRIVVITELPVVSATVNACSGSTADVTVTATGSIAPYDVSWSGASSGNPTGPEIAASAGTYVINALGSGSYTITVTASNGCVGTTIAPVSCGGCTNPTIDTQASPITECIGSTQQLTIVASGTTLTYQWYSNSTNSITGGTLLTSETNATFTPPSLSSGTVYYYCIVNSGTCATTSDAVAVIVTPNNTAGLPSSSAAVCLNSAISPAITITSTDATGIGAATGLPAGVSASWSGNTITISGTPTVTGTFNYTIPLTGGCGTVNATGTFTVIDVNTAGAASSSPNVCLNSPISPSITISTTGATGIGAATGLPAGVSASWFGDVITISGTPTTTGTFNYTIPLTGGCGTVNATGTFTVIENNTVGTASSSPSICLGAAISPNITFTTTGATGIGSPTGLPAGVSASWSGNIITISGTPTASGTFNYSIPLTGGCGTLNATGTITINVNPTAGISGTLTFCSGGSTNLTTSGGGTYNWSNSLGTNSTVTVSSGGTFTVTVTSNGCTATTSALVVVNNCNNFGEFASPDYVQTSNTQKLTNNKVNTTGSVINQISATPFQLNNFGSYFQNSGQLKLQGGEMKTWKNNPGNVCGVTLYYRIYPSLSVPSGAFSSITLPFFQNCSSGSFASGGPCGGSDQKWQRPGNANPLANIDLTTYTPNTYNLEIYYDIQGSNVSNSSCETTYSVNNSGANYISTFTIVAPPTASNSGAYCAGESIDLSATNGGNTYSWSGPNSFSTSTQNPTISNSTSAMGGTYTVTVSLANNCTTTALTNIVVNANPSVDLSCSNICPGTTTTVSAIPNPTGTYSYAWTVPSGASAPGNVASFSSGVTGTYSVIITNTTTNCESQADNCTINIQAQPSLIFLSPP